MTKAGFLFIWVCKHGKYPKNIKMKKLFLISLLFICQVANAQISKNNIDRSDPDGFYTSWLAECLGGMAYYLDEKVADAYCQCKVEYFALHLTDSDLLKPYKDTLALIRNLDPAATKFCRKHLTDDDLNRATELNRLEKE